MQLPEKYKENLDVSKFSLYFSVSSILIYPKISQNWINTGLLGRTD
jgi:hypothetical protein